MQPKTINGKMLSCLMCGHTSFEVIKTLINRRFLAVFDLELISLFNKKNKGTAYICKNCGFKHEFFEDLPAKR